MLWFCRFTWYQATTAMEVRRRILEQHDAGAIGPRKIRGWYNLAGGGAGFLLSESDDPRDLTRMLEPYMDLMSWDVHAVYELPYEKTIESFRQAVRKVS